MGSRARLVDLLIELCHLGGDRIPGKATNAQQSPLAEGRSQGGILVEMVDSIGDRAGILGVHLESGLADHFGEGRLVGGDDGDAAGHGFEEGHAEAFVGGGGDQEIGGVVILHEGGAIGTACGSDG